jgi:hypothetical protein
MKRTTCITALLMFYTMICLQLKLIAQQEEQTFYITSTSYQSFQVDKVPFGMKKITAIVTKEGAITVADKTFTPASIKGGGFIYLTPGRDGYLFVIDKPETVGFIVCPDGKSWSCYFRYKKEKMREKIPPVGGGDEELAFLKTAIGNIIDPRVKYCYLTYSSFASKGNTSFAEDSLPIIYASPDTILVSGIPFTKKLDNLFVSGRTYLYMPDKETMVFRDPDITSWASFYQKDANKANALIRDQYKSEKELAAANNTINNMASSRMKAVINSYFANARSKKSDPALASTILKYWNSHWPGGPAFKVIFLDDNLHVTTNSLNIPLRKSISAWVLYKQDGKCFAQWNEYGYAYAGGGTYAKEFTQWKINDANIYVDANTTQGREFLYSGHQFELDGNVIK